MRPFRWIAVILVPLLGGCATGDSALRSGDRFWSELHSLCGQAFEGKMVEGTEPSDAEIGEQTLIMHVRRCTPEQIRIPFHVGDDHSRTWVLTRTDGGFRLEHDHRHEDGSEDAISRYGGDATGLAGPLTVEFRANDFTAELIPAAATNVWTIAIDPGKSFTYALRREEGERRFRVLFDLTRPVPLPPPPWYRGK